MGNGIVAEHADHLNQRIVCFHIRKKIRSELCRSGFTSLEADDINEFDGGIDGSLRRKELGQANKPAIRDLYHGMMSFRTGESMRINVCACNCLKQGGCH